MHVILIWIPEVIGCMISVLVLNQGDAEMHGMLIHVLVVRWPEMMREADS